MIQSSEADQGAIWRRRMVEAVAGDVRILDFTVVGLSLYIA